MRYAESFKQFIRGHLSLFDAPYIVTALVCDIAFCLTVVTFLVVVSCYCFCSNEVKSYLSSLCESFQRAQ